MTQSNKGVVYTVDHEWCSEEAQYESTYLPLEVDEDELRNLQAMISEGHCTERQFFMVVPFGEKYYPLPLVFSTKELRAESADKEGLQAPSEQWVRRMRRAIVAQYNLTAGPSAGVHCRVV